MDCGHIPVLADYSGQYCFLLFLVAFPLKFCVAVLNAHLKYLAGFQRRQRRRKRAPIVAVIAAVRNVEVVSWPGDHTGWSVQGQTNPVTRGISTNWVTIPGSTATNQLFVPVDKVNGTVFFRMIYP